MNVEIINMEQLNHDFGMDGLVSFVHGKGDLVFISVTGKSSTAQICLNGGQVLSFKPAGHAHDLLFVSNNAYYQYRKATKGGTPVCWPWFGPHAHDASLQVHGFVRNRVWQVESVRQNAQDEIIISLVFEDTEETRAIWPYAFKLTQVITIADTLSIELQSLNTGTQVFEVTQAVHTYFNVGDINKTQVTGLDGKVYLDKVDNFASKTQSGPVIFNGETDRIYQDVIFPLEIRDESLNRSIIIEAKNSATAVVWNPWSEIAKKSADLVDSDYEIFVCVETANAAREVILVQPGETSSMSTRYRIV